MQKDDKEKSNLKKDRVYKLAPAERESIERGLEAYRNGNFITNEELEKNDKWLNSKD